MMETGSVEQVKRRYRQSLPDKANKLQKLWDEARRQPQDLLDFLHQLAGSSGMYGYGEISAQAKALRTRLDTDSVDMQCEALHEEFTRLQQMLLDQDHG